MLDWREPLQSLRPYSAQPFLPQAPNSISMNKVLVTAGHTGLGLAVAKRFRGLGCRVYTTSRTHEFASLTCDMTNISDIKRLATWIKDECFDLIIHSASLGQGQYFSSSIDDLIDWSTLVGAAHVIGQYAVMNSPDAKVVFVGSIAGAEGNYSKNYSIYSQYKHSLAGVVEAARLEGANATYLKLGSFSEEGDGKTQLNTEVVASKVVDLITQNDMF